MHCSDMRQSLMYGFNSISKSQNSGLIVNIPSFASSVFFAFSSLHGDFFEQVPIKRVQLAERANDFSDAIRDYISGIITDHRALTFINDHKNKILFSR